MPKQKAVDLSQRPINQVSTEAFRAIKGLLSTCQLRGSDVPLYNSVINVIDRTIAFDTENGLTAETIAAAAAPKKARRKRHPKAAEPEPAPAPAPAPAKKGKRGRKLPAKNRSAND